MTEALFEITKTATFDAAHSLQIGGAESPYRRLHGHSFRVEASVRGPVSEAAGWVADFAELDEALKAVAAALDHQHLNQLPGLERPTLERLCAHFAEQLRPGFPGLSRVVVSRPSVGESCALNL